MKYSSTEHNSNIQMNNKKKIEINILKSHWKFLRFFLLLLCCSILSILFHYTGDGEDGDEGKMNKIQ